ncbi:MAG: FtsQ-type POTRA domain-containing protein [Alphaproteobacteria bacterium]|nr:FtsQ-type POTRA domain-containing protein [Alphaproteobacteria bacterium]
MALIRKQHRIPNRRRKGFLSVALPWLKRFGLTLAALVFLGWAGSWLWLSGSVSRTLSFTQEFAYRTTADMGFRVKNILVEGRIHADAEILKAIINTDEGAPILSFDPRQAKAFIERIEWVKTARVERRLPDTIYIGLQERTPLALWQKDQKLSVLDEEGKIITAQGISRFADLIIVMGEGAPEQAPAFLADLAAEPSLYKRATSARYVGHRRWDLVLDRKITIKLPEEERAFALSRLAQAQAENALLDRDIESVDLRETDRIVVQTRPGGVQEYQAGLKPGSEI